MFSLISLFIACDKNSDEIIQNQETGIEYKTLSSSEVTLKNQLAEAAKIVTEISTDESVLAEIVATIKAQPKIMEDRVKFKDLMNPTEGLKSKVIGVETGKFASAFKSKLTSNGLKSVSTLIEELSEQGIEVYIPYPIEDYPEGVDIVVTSHPIDNIYENVGYVIGKPGVEVMANDELAETHPVIILTSPLYSDEELQQFAASRAKMDQNAKAFNELRLKSANTGAISWEDESTHFGIYIPKIFCTNDYTTGLFGVGTMIVTSGTVTFDTSTKIVISEVDKGTFSFALPRKYEGYAQDKYSKGWFECNLFIWQDWQPAITENSITFCMDTPNQSTTLSTGLSASWLSEATQAGSKLSSTYGVTQSCSTTITARDVIYCSKKWSRERYIYDYSCSGDAWGEVGETTFPADGYGQRPALTFSTELKLITYCQTW